MRTVGDFDQDSFDKPGGSALAPGCSASATASAPSSAWWGLAAAETARRLLSCRRARRCDLLDVVALRCWALVVPVLVARVSNRCDRRVDAARRARTARVGAVHAAS
jgi:hypothetical protein